MDSFSQESAVQPIHETQPNSEKVKQEEREWPFDNNVGWDDSN